MKVINWVENSDGSANMTYELNRKEEKLLREYAESNNKVYSHKFVNDILLKAIKEEVTRNKNNENKSSILQLLKASH
jgi:hypothetical protein